VAATDTASRPLGWLALAALAVPGVMPRLAAAEEAPERAVFAVKHLHYEDSQAVQTNYPFYDGSEPASFSRIRVDSPSMLLSLPIGRQWLLDAGAVLDEVSGATPRYYTDISGASRMSDRRVAADLKVTRFQERTALAVGLSHSSENDYVSNALSVEARWSSEDNNNTLTGALGLASDTIRPTEGGVRDIDEEQKHSVELMVGLTSALTRNDLVQVMLTLTFGRGYFTDPYKQFDNRPRRRDAGIYLMRWNHHLPRWGASLRTSYRYYNDTFGIGAHTVEAQWVQPLDGGLKLAPLLRYHTQSSAKFYYDPVTDLEVYPGLPYEAEYSSVDQRLSAFGGITLGLKAEYGWGAWTADAKIERYEQRPEWRLGGSGSLGIDTFRATMLQVGLAYSF
jgi:hypothetical protein